MRYSPDGKRLAFTSMRSESYRLWVCDADGTNAARVPGVDHAVYFAPTWSPDGRFLAYDAGPEGNYDVYVVGADGGTPRRLTDDPAVDLPAAWSHDGRWIYFASDRSGSLQLWKVSPEGGDAVQLTRDGTTSAFEPRDTWYHYAAQIMLDGGTPAFESRDGRYVYYHKGRGGSGLWRIPVEGGEEELVWDEAGADFGGRWVLADDGVYFATRVGDQAVIEFYSFMTRTRTKVASVPQVDGLALSPDGRRLLYRTVERRDYNIFLVENVRL
jgi:Tol biopolymer transport system component